MQRPRNGQDRRRDRAVGAGPSAAPGALEAFASVRLLSLPPARIEVPADRSPLLTGSDEFPLRVSHGDLSALGLAARLDPSPGASVAVAEWGRRQSVRSPQVIPAGYARPGAWSEPWSIARIAATRARISNECGEASAGGSTTVMVARGTPKSAVAVVTMWSPAFPSVQLAAAGCRQVRDRVQSGVPVPLRQHPCFGV